ncbi:uncharacterized protein L203_101518 [Cryptococcus depauperatus CBS 7841]|uniref:Uncharacterized protein n=1 Tax=Cryptococcus depauperatus CBS 7841 TaxID=1295531 RepID=A0AAJ8LZC4_9TREE
MERFALLTPKETTHVPIYTAVAGVIDVLGESAILIESLYQRRRFAKHSKNSDPEVTKRLADLDRFLEKIHCRVFSPKDDKHLLPPSTPCMDQSQTQSDEPKSRAASTKVWDVL